MRIDAVASIWLIAAAVMAPIPSAEAETTKPSQTEPYLAEFADCVVAQKGRRTAVTAFVRTVPNSSGFFAASMKAADLTCLNAAARRTGGKLEMRMQPEAFRYALYPALYRRDFGHEAPVAATVTDAPPIDLASEFDGDIAQLPSTYRPSRAFGDCVVRENPAGAHALLMAKPFSRADTAAVEELKPSFAACLSEGQTVRLTRPAMRAFVGEAAYKLALAGSRATG